MGKMESVPSRQYTDEFKAEAVRLEGSIGGNPAAERFVIFINNGFRSTPTLVFGRERYKILITEPADEELAAVLALAGYSLPSENT